MNGENKMTDHRIKQDNLPKHKSVYTLVVLGFSGAGKSNICSRFLGKEFSDEDRPTANISFRSKNIKLDEKNTEIQLWEIPPEMGASKKNLWDNKLKIREHGIVVCYDIADKDSFALLDAQISRLKETEGNDVPFMLIGNKSDLEHLRQVSEEEGNALAAKHGIFFMETSARTDTNIQNAFVTLIEEIHIPTPQRRAIEIKSLKDGINAPLRYYQEKQGKKFGFFEKSADRQNTLIRLQQNITPIFKQGEKNGLTRDDHMEIAQYIYHAINETKQSHEKGSIAGQLGWTDSRLAVALQKSLDDLLQKTGITIEDVIEQDKEKNNTKTILIN